jgi:hypothetical protein
VLVDPAISARLYSPDVETPPPDEALPSPLITPPPPSRAIAISFLKNSELRRNSELGIVNRERRKFFILHSNS